MMEYQLNTTQCKMLILLAILFSLLLSTRPAQAQLTSVPDAESIDCNGSPFGRTLAIGAEDEHLLVTNSGGSPIVDLFDLSANGDYDFIDGKTTNASWLQDTSLNASVAADLDGDGRSELVQGMRDSDGRFFLESLHANNADGTDIAYISNHIDSSLSIEKLAMAAGRITNNETGQEVVAVAYEKEDSIVEVDLWWGYDNGVLVQHDYFSGPWQSSITAEKYVLDIATGDVDLDGRDEVVVVMSTEFPAPFPQSPTRRYTIYVLGYEQNDLAGTASLVQEGWRTYDRLASEAPIDMSVHVGNVMGNFQREIIINDEYYRSDINAYVSRFLTFETANIQRDGFNEVTGFDIEYRHETVIDGFDSRQGADNLVLADMDRDGVDEVVTAYTYASSNPNILINAYDVSPTGTSVGLRKIDSSLTDHVYSIAAGDMDKNGYADVVTTHYNPDLKNIEFRRWEAGIATEDTGIVERAQRSVSLTTGPTNFSTHLADWDNDSTRAELSSRCHKVYEPQVVTVGHLPPFWSALQSDLEHDIVIGKERTQATTTETGLRTNTSHSFNAYAGLGVEGDVGVASVKAVVKATFGYESAVSNETRRGAEETTSVARGTATIVEHGVVLMEQSEFDCYAFDFMKEGATLDGEMRLCEHISSSQGSSTLLGWDTDQAYNHNTNNAPLQWLPLQRDWSNLALFTNPTMTGANPDLTVDGDLTTIADLNDPTWRNWSVDLGEVHPLTSIRIWPDLNDVPSLADIGFTIYVSDEPLEGPVFIFDGDPNVHQFSVAADSRAARVFNFNLRQFDNDDAMITGRYIRIETNHPSGSGTLGIAEVQVFGDLHIEPYRYPTAIRDFEPDDDWFEVKLFNQRTNSIQWVKQRGQIVWDGTESIEAIDSFGAEEFWSVTNSTTQFNSVISSTGTTFRVGAQIETEASAGVAVKAVAEVGGGYEYSTGVTEDSVRTTSWGSGVSIGGRVIGPSAGLEQEVIDTCSYKIQPYSYIIRDQTSYTTEHEYLVVDYIVTDAMARSRDFSPCLSNNSVPLAISLSSIEAQLSITSLVLAMGVLLVFITSWTRRRSQC